MPKTKYYQHKPGKTFDESRLPEAEQFARANLRALVTRYEAVRCTRCRERDHAEYALGLALRRFGYPFEWDGLVWCWCHSLDSITRSRAAGAHQTLIVHEHKAGADSVSQSHRRRRGAECGRGQAFGGWSIKGRSL